MLPGRGDGDGWDARCRPGRDDSVRRDFIDFHFAGDQLMRGLGPQRLEQPLDDRVLRWAELRRVAYPAMLPAEVLRNLRAS